MSNVTDAVTWYQNLGQAIPSVFGGPNGIADGLSLGTIVNQQRDLLKAGIKASYPHTAPPDALPRIGGDRGLLQGVNESTASYVARLIDAWGQNSRRGLACGVLEQLYYFGFQGAGAAVWVQPNGNTYTFGNATLTPGQDPTSLLVQSNLSMLSTALTSNLTPPTTTGSAGRSIPTGTPWIAFDSNTDLTNRFAILINTNAWPFSALTTAYFNGVDNAAITWPFTFASSSYMIQIGTPVVTDGSGGVVLHADGATQTQSGVTIRSSAPFRGYASVLAFAAGVNPLNIFSSASAGALQGVISTFRPNAVCMGVFAIQSGRMWDWPTNTTWDGLGGQWDIPSSISQILSQF